MRLEHPKEKIDIIGRLRNFEAAFVLLLIRKSNPQGEFFCDEVNSAQPHRELLQKTAQHKEERLCCFNFVFEFEALVERLRRPHELKQSLRFPIRALPHSDRFGTKPCGELLFIKCGELAEGMNPPLVQDR